MGVRPATALAGWAVGTAWLALFVILEHFDREGPDLIDFVQWGALVPLLLFFPFLRRRFAHWLEKQKGP